MVQEGALCAQHCLNALLQGPYYTAVDLASLAQQLDDEERNALAQDQQRFGQQPSGNMDDTGFFSLQVLAKAIEVWGLDLVNLNSSDERAVAARRSVTSQNAYICNFREHWFTIRKIGYQWFDLNSLLTAAALVTDTYLSLFLAQLQTEGYSIYIVCGALPECPANEILKVTPAVQSERPPLMSAEQVRGTSSTRPSQDARPNKQYDEEEALQQAMALSMAQQGASGTSIGRNEEDDFNLALQLSRSMASGSPKKQESGAEPRSEEDDIQRAIQMSLQPKSPKKPSGLSPPATKTPAASKPHKVSPATSISASQLASASKSQKTQMQKRLGDVGSNVVSLAKSNEESKEKPHERTFTPPSPSQLRPSSGFRSQASPMNLTPPGRRAGPPVSPLAGRGSSVRPGIGAQVEHFDTMQLEATRGIGRRLGGTSSSDAATSSSRGSRQRTPDPEEVRRRRLAFLEKLGSQNVEESDQK